MNQPVDTTPSPDRSWDRSDHHPAVPNTSLLPDAKPGSAPAIDLMKRVVRGAHSTLDGLADSAAPTVRQVGEAVSGTQAALQAGASHVSTLGGVWVDQARSTVRRYPITCTLGALALGALLARGRR